MRRLVSDERGQVAPLVAVCLLGLVAIAGLVVDGGMMFSVRREIQSLADGAARAGAMAVDESALRTSGGESIKLDPEAARRAAEGYLTVARFDGTYEIEPAMDSVTVRLSAQHRTVLMSIVGLKTFEAEAFATASPRSGP